MAHTEVFSNRGAIPLFDAGRIVVDRSAKKTSFIGSFLRFVLFSALLVGAGYGGLQWWKWRHTPSWAQNGLGEERSTANDHLPASLPEIRVKGRDEP